MVRPQPQADERLYGELITMQPIEKPNTVSESVERRPLLQEDREFGSWSSQINDLANLYLSLPSLTLGINRLEQGLVSSVRG